jgi:hypothetical protein
MLRPQVLGKGIALGLEQLGVLFGFEIIRFRPHI